MGACDTQHPVVLCVWSSRLAHKWGRRIHKKTILTLFRHWCWEEFDGIILRANKVHHGMVSFITWLFNLCFSCESNHPLRALLNESTLRIWDKLAMPWWRLATAEVKHRTPGVGIRRRSLSAWGWGRIVTTGSSSWMNSFGSCVAVGIDEIN